MSKGITIKLGYTSSELRRLAASSRHANQSRRLLSIAAVLDGMSRAEAAKIGGMDRQTLRDWVHRFNARGPDGLKDDLAPGEAAPVVRDATGGTGRDRRDRPGSRRRWRGALAAHRPSARHRGALRGRVSRAHHRQAAEGSGLLAYQRPAAAPQAGWRGHRRRSKKLPQHARGPPRGA